ncbi:MAG: FkbM family methyltransferase [Ferruginibacter sp.]
MSVKRKIQFWYIRLHRYLLGTKYLRIMDGPLKGLKWVTSMNYQYLTGDYIDEVELSLLKNNLDTTEPVFYDVGANVGYFSMTVKKLVPRTEVYAFEPMPDHIQTFRKHLRLNNLHGIELVEKAVSGKSGPVTFSGYTDSEGNTYKTESALFKNAPSTITIESTTIDDFVATSGKVPQLIKIDVEGAELDVLEGALKTLHTHHPVLLLATHECHVPGIEEKCVHFLKHNGYSVKPVTTDNKHVPGLQDYIARPI